jgi:hypothetical protein
MRAGRNDPRAARFERSEDLGNANGERRVAERSEATVWASDEVVSSEP